MVILSKNEIDYLNYIQNLIKEISELYIKLAELELNPNPNESIKIYSEILVKEQEYKKFINRITFQNPKDFSSAEFLLDKYKKSKQIPIESTFKNPEVPIYSYKITLDMSKKMNEALQLEQPNLVPIYDRIYHNVATLYLKFIDELISETSDQELIRYYTHQKYKIYFLGFRQIDQKDYFKKNNSLEIYESDFFKKDIKLYKEYKDTSTKLMSLELFEEHKRTIIIKNKDLNELEAFAELKLRTAYIRACLLVADERINNIRNVILSKLDTLYEANQYLPFEEQYNITIEENRKAFLKSKLDSKKIKIK